MLGVHAISHPSTSDCYAVGSDGSGAPEFSVTTDVGATWATQSSPTGLTDPRSISCPSTSDRTAVGGSDRFVDIAAATDGGA